MATTVQAPDGAQMHLLFEAIGLLDPQINKWKLLLQGFRQVPGHLSAYRAVCINSRTNLDSITPEAILPEGYSTHGQQYGTNMDEIGDGGESGSDDEKYAVGPGTPPPLPLLTMQQLEAITMRKPPPLASTSRIARSPSHASEGVPMGLEAYADGNRRSAMASSEGRQRLNRHRVIFADKEYEDYGHSGRTRALGRRRQSNEHEPSSDDSSRPARARQRVAQNTRYRSDDDTSGFDSSGSENNYRQRSMRRRHTSSSREQSQQYGQECDFESADKSGQSARPLYSQWLSPPRSQHSRNRQSPERPQQRYHSDPRSGSRLGDDNRHYQEYCTGQTVPHYSEQARSPPREAPRWEDQRSNSSLLGLQRSASTPVFGMLSNMLQVRLSQRFLVFKDSRQARQFQPHQACMPLHLDSAFQRLYKNKGPSDTLQRELGVLLRQVRVVRTRSFDNEVKILEVADIPKELAETAIGVIKYCARIQPMESIIFVAGREKEKFFKRLHTAGWIDLRDGYAIGRNTLHDGVVCSTH